MLNPLIYIFLFILSNLGSGFHNRLKIKEIQPFSNVFISQYLKQYSNLKDEVDIQKYIKLFDGNMKDIKAYIESKLSLTGSPFLNSYDFIHN